MTCYHPVKAFRTPTGVVFQELARHDIIGTVFLACGQCIGCRMRRASDWELRVMHEAKSHDSNCFVTLTYAPGNLPPGGSLEHRDFQLFLKRVRKRCGPVRFYMCGEYGDLNQRPHYHACLFGVDFRSDRKPAGKSSSGFVFYESEVLTSVWGLGRCTVQDLTPQSAGYTARYVMKKALGDDAKVKYARTDSDGVISYVKPEYAACSLKPGIGYSWFNAYSRDCYPHDFVISDGAKRPLPRYYDKLLKRVDRVTLEDVQYKRELKARESVSESSPERLAVREVVHKARVSTLKRNLES